MKYRTLVFVVGILIIAQILFYIRMQTDNIEIINQKVALLDSDIRQMESEKQNLTERFGYLRKIIDTIPPHLLVGFEDPESGFVEFLDYLQTPLLEEVKGEISLRDIQKFKQQPVPLHESNFSFKFSFFQTYEAEKFLNYLLIQERFPLQVYSLKIDRTTEGETNGSLQVALLIPAKLELPSLTAQKEGK